MKCSVKGCHQESTGSPKGSDKYNLCPFHFEAWGWYRLGYEKALGVKSDENSDKPPKTPANGYTAK